MNARTRRGGRAASAHPAGGAPSSAWWVPAAAFVAALAVFAPSFGHHFVRDDHGLITTNPALRGGPLDVAGAVLDDFHAGSGGGSGKWRPLVTLSYAVEGAAGGFEPHLFHAVNVFAHAAASAVLALLLLAAGLPAWPALAGAVWFAVMPVHVESVAWISGRTDVFAALFVLAALWADRAARGRAPRPPWFAVGLFALGLASKEIALAFVAVIALDAWRDPRLVARAARVRWLMPYGIAAALYLAFWFVIGAIPAPPEAMDAGRADAIRRGMAWFLPALLRFFLPGVTHAPDWPLPASATLADPRVVAGALATLGLFVLAAWGVWRRARWSTPLLVLLVPLLPPLATGLLLAAGGAVAAERVLYLPSAGAAWLLALGVAWLAAQPAVKRAGVPFVAVALAPLIAAAAWTTWHDQAMYRNDAALYTALHARVPGSAIGAAGLATVRMQAGRLDEAQALLDRAAVLDPRMPEVPQARAEIAFATAQYAEVERHADEALRLRPSLAYARILRAAARVRRGAPAPALDSLIAAYPGDPLLLSALGERQVAAGRTAEAVAPLAQAMRAQGGDPATGLAYARALAAEGRTEEATAVLDHTLRLNPGARDAMQLRATLAEAAGDTALAAALHARRAALRAQDAEPGSDP